MLDYEHPQHEMICFKIQLPGHLVFIFSIYRPPSADDSICDAISSHINTIQEFHPRSEIIALGDMNVHHEEWLGNKKADIHGVCAFEFVVLTNLHQPDGDDSKLDLSLTTSPDNHVQLTLHLVSLTMVLYLRWPAIVFLHPA